LSVAISVILGDTSDVFDSAVGPDPVNQVTGVPQEDRQAVTHGTRVSVTIAAKIAATTPSTARGTMPIQYLGIGSSR
jgi:hypothetical protein